MLSSRGAGSPAPVSFKGKGAIEGGTGRGADQTRAQGDAVPLALGGPADSLGWVPPSHLEGARGTGTDVFNALVNAASECAQHQNKNQKHRDGPRAPRVPHFPQSATDSMGRRLLSLRVGRGCPPGAVPGQAGGPCSVLCSPLLSVRLSLSQGLLSWISDLPRQSRVSSNCIRRNPLPQQ